MTATQHTIHLSHSTMKYWEYNHHKKQTIIMVHGFTGSHEGFQYIVPLLEDFHIIIPDLPGFGESTLTGDHSLDTLARITNEFIQRLQLKEPPYLLSHSMGGLVAASMLRQAPDLYNKTTIFISPVATAVARADSRRVGQLLGLAQYGIGKKVPLLGERLVKSKTISRVTTRAIIKTRDKQLRKDIYNHHFKNLDYVSSIALYHTLHREINRRGVIDEAALLSTFDVHIINGNRDNVTPLKTEKHLAAAVHAQLHIINGAGHLAHYEHPSEIADFVKSILR